VKERRMIGRSTMMPVNLLFAARRLLTGKKQPPPPSRPATAHRPSAGAEVAATPSCCVTAYARWSSFAVRLCAVVVSSQKGRNAPQPKPKRRDQTRHPGGGNRGARDTQTLLHHTYTCIHISLCSSSLHACFCYGRPSLVAAGWLRCGWTEPKAFLSLSTTPQHTKEHSKKQSQQDSPL
jgi:hypothetical protein